MEFQIGDKVGFVNAFGEGIIKAKFRGATGGISYLVGMRDGDEILFSEKELRPIEKAATYTYELELLENVFVARLYEVKGDVKTEVARGHGHIIHEGVLGVDQAASYALKRIYEAVGGSF